MSASTATLVAAPCPECGIGRLSVDLDATVGETYHPGYHVRGRELPVRERAAVVAACNACEFCIELKGVSR